MEEMTNTMVEETVEEVVKAGTKGKGGLIVLGTTLVVIGGIAVYRKVSKIRRDKKAESEEMELRPDFDVEATEEDIQ